jgi:GNAT superfamily N-acetyltransferase
MTAVTFRNAGPEDAAAMAELGRRSFVETFGHLYHPQDLALFLVNHSAGKWAEELADPAFKVRIAESEGAAVAYAKLGPPSLPFEPRAASAELRQFYVLKPWHGGGVAQTLMAWAIKEAKRAGAKDLYLSVFEDNHRARRFYDRYGFEHVCDYAFMVGYHADLDHVMRLALEDQE